MRPEKDTPEYELWLCSIDVAHAAPLKKGQNVRSASIPWRTIEALRSALDALDIPWKETHPSTRKG